MRASRPLPRKRRTSAVPVRSGQTRGGRNFWRRLLSLLFILGVVIGGISFALASPTFHVQQVSIEGTHNAELIATIRRMGIQGQNIFLLNPAVLVAHLETLPLVNTASLKVVLPGRVTITIQERVPALLWQVGHTTFGVAQDGMVIAPRSELSGTERLSQVLDERRVSGMHPGMRLAIADVAFAEESFAQLPGIQGVVPFTLHYIDRIAAGTQSAPANVTGRGSYMVASANGWRAYLGDANNNESLGKRLLELQQILDIARQQHLQLATIDLRFGERPVYTVKS
jgi:hypothetical protein